jgi:protein involved in ribonucleotide reduction
VPGNVRKAVEDLEIRMKVDKMEKKVKDRKVLVARKRNVGKTVGKVQQTIKQFLEKKNEGKLLFGLGSEEGGRKRRLSGLGDVVETSEKKTKGSR